VNHVARDVSGRDYLALVTTLLQRSRLADPDAGQWEAADFQWWWRRDQHAEPSRATFWFDDDDAPVGAVVFTDWGENWGCDVLTTADDSTVSPEALWDHAFARMPSDPAKPVEVAARDDDEFTIAVLAEAGFTGTDEVAVPCWMNAADRRAVTAVADRYRLMSRATATAANRPHHMILRNGPAVADHLRECSLYRPDLDLYVEADPDGDAAVAAYGLFWADPITGVGLVEPMRTEDAHQDQRLGKHVLTTGVDLLAASGCTRIKVTYMEGNAAAQRLYVNSGFVPQSPSRAYRLPQAR
jgi:RimJ/RimL family protein N-acetyltransferase